MTESDERHTGGFRRLHPLTMLYRGIVSLPGILLGIITAVNRSEQTFTIILIIIFAIFALPGIVLGYYYFRFAITPRELVIHKGVLSRTTRNIPIERIQNIAVHQNFLQRILRIAKVQIETAGGQETEGELEFVSTAEADNIRRMIRSYQDTSQGTAGAAAAPGTESIPVLTPDAETQEASNLVFSMSARDVVLCGMFGFSFVFVAIIFTGMQYFGVSPEGLVESITDEQISYLRSLDEATLWLFGAVALFIAVVLSWVTGILLTLNRYYNFRLTLDDGKLYKQSGLLTLSKATIPLKKLQMLVITSNPLSRRFGFRALELQTAGFGTKQKGPEVAVPLAKKERVQELAAMVLPFSYPETFRPVSPLTIRRAMVRYSALVVIAATAGSLLLSPSAWWLLVILPLLYYPAVLRFRARGYTVDEQNIIVKQGVWRERIAVIPLRRIQTISVSETLFQRRLGLATLLVDTAATSSGADAAIIDIAADDARAIAGEVMAAFHASYNKSVRWKAENETRIMPSQMP